MGDYDLLPVAQLERSGKISSCRQNLRRRRSLHFQQRLLLKTTREIRDQIAARGRQLENTKPSAASTRPNSAPAIWSTSWPPPLPQPLRAAAVASHRDPPGSSVDGLWPAETADRRALLVSNRIKVNGELDAGTPLLPGYDHWNPLECFTAAPGADHPTAGRNHRRAEYILRLIYDAPITRQS